MVHNKFPWINSAVTANTGQSATNCRCFLPPLRYAQATGVWQTTPLANAWISLGEGASDKSGHHGLQRITGRSNLQRRSGGSRDRSASNAIIPAMPSRSSALRLGRHTQAGRSGAKGGRLSALGCYLGVAASGGCSRLPPLLRPSATVSSARP